MMLLLKIQCKGLSTLVNQSIPHMHICAHMCTYKLYLHTGYRPDSCPLLHRYARDAVSCQLWRGPHPSPTAFPECLRLSPVTYSPLRLPPAPPADVLWLRLRPPSDPCGLRVASEHQPVTPGPGPVQPPVAHRQRQGPHLQLPIAHQPGWEAGQPRAGKEGLHRAVPGVGSLAQSAGGHSGQGQALRQRSGQSQHRARRRPGCDQVSAHTEHRLCRCCWCYLWLTHHTSSSIMPPFSAVLCVLH